MGTRGSFSEGKAAGT